MAMETGNPAGGRKRASRLLGQRLIKVHFQFKYAITVFILLGASCLVIWLFGTLAINHMVAAGVVSGTHAIENLRLLNRVIGQMSIFALALVFALSLLFSHFIAGPIYRFEKTLEAVRDGDLTIVVRLRARDEFKEMAELFNQALGSLRLRLQTERDVVEAAVEKAGKLAESLRQAGHAAEAGELERLISPVRELPVRVRIK
jgi:methyl-accepting chemotaxis protein